MMTWQIKCAVRILAVAAAIVGSASAQEVAKTQEKTSHPRIGIALAGGSARGFAHIGVLKWLYEHHIPVESVAGTSMGGLVGGLYAAGYTPEEIEKFLKQVDWEEAMQLVPPYGDLAFRRREDRRDYPIKIELGLHNGLRGPSGLSPGHGVGLLISRFTSPYARMKSFDDLPTPFRCVASDLVSGKQVVFQDGDMFDALRATMSLPGIFDPVILGDKVLVDGGMLNNLPVSVVKDMKVDLIIAVTLGMPDNKDIASLSLLGVADRSLDIMIADNVMRNLQLADLVLAPDLKGLYSSDFTKPEEFSRRGYEEAVRKARFLQSLAVDDATWQAYVEGRARRRRPEIITPQFARIEGAQAGETKELEHMVSKLAGKPLDTAEVDASLTRLTGLGRYNRADYRQIEESGNPGLLIKLGKKNHGPSILNLLFDVDGTEVGDVRFGIGARLTVMDLGTPYSEWRTEARVGSANVFSSEYYWRIGGSKLFLAPQGYVDFRQQNLFVGTTRVGEYRVEKLGAGLDLGVALSRKDEFRVGYEARHINAFVTTGSPLLPSVKGFMSVASAHFAHEGLDSAVIPTRGWRFTTGMDWVMEDPVVSREYPVFDTRITGAASLTRRTIFIGTMAGGTTAGRTGGIPPFTLGGPFRLSALSREQLRGSNYYHAGFFLLRSLSEKPLTFLKHTYFGMAYEVGDAFNNVSRSDPFHSGTVGIFSETILGAVFVGAGIGEQGQYKLFFRVGRVF